MNGPSLTPILVPVAGTLLLIAWLILVFVAGRHAERPAAATRPAAAIRPTAAIRPDTDAG
ncbi:MAG TPA: hypothetical protein VKU77_32795 [Streptosporangiaceae bacterium]|nr:hypothetical protein [Streptosporangiaceae bacterium]